MPGGMFFAVLGCGLFLAAAGVFVAQLCHVSPLL
jgi:hypothetical protein